MIFFLLALTATRLPYTTGPVNLAHDYAVHPVPFTAVHLTDKFWAPKIEINRTVSIPTALQKCEETQRVQHFLDAAATLRGEGPSNKATPGYPFDDTDLYKVIEGASYSLSVHPDPKLDAYVDHLIAVIGAAQESDGYLYTARTINPAKPHEWSGKERWVLEQDNSHELYDSGHLIEAAVAHFQATGKRNFIDIAIKNADLLVRTFGPGKRKAWPGHEIIEMALAKLYRTTGNRQYLDLAKFFLDSRGGSAEYWQAHKPVVEQTEAVGHAVRASYLYSGMADVAALTGDQRYLNAVDALWQNVVGKKIYLTGGIGATASGEAFGGNYELPNMSAYNETCAAVGNDYWNYRLFLMHADAKYIDVLERTLYNGLISGVSLDGKTYFYPNPLESRGQHQRSPWFGVACCPGNITRFMASVPGYVYATKGNQIYANLFAGGQADIKLDGGKTVHLSQETNYPWSGKITFTVGPKSARAFDLHVRIPGWAQNRPIPSNLYAFQDQTTEQPSLSVNGKSLSLQTDKGYVVIHRSWKPGDRVELNLPMPVRKVVANNRVSEDQGKVALQRGPIVYCAEGKDNPGGKVLNILAPEGAIIPHYEAGLLHGVVTLKGTSKSLAFQADGSVKETAEAFTAIPYYAWANRGRGEMAVWLASDVKHASPSMLPTLASAAKVTTSGGSSPEAINALHEPKNSLDQSMYFHWWPKKGTREWVEYAFAEPTTIHEADLYWFDDTNLGECRIPKSWRLMSWQGGAWVPVETSDSFGVAKDTYNRLTFTPVTTLKLRLEVDLQAGWSGGIQQWRLR